MSEDDLSEAKRQFQNCRRPNIEYDWSKLSAGWSYEKHSDELVVKYRGCWLSYAVAQLEQGVRPDCCTAAYSELWPQALGQLEKCRKCLLHEYDWSKLDPGWSLRANGTQLTYAGTFWDIAVLEFMHAGSPDKARAQLEKCRVSKEPPQPQPAYNWNLLKDTGWREGNGPYITDGTFLYWYTLGDRPKLETYGTKFTAAAAKAAETRAAELVARCAKAGATTHNLQELTAVCHKFDLAGLPCDLDTQDVRIEGVLLANAQGRSVRLTGSVTTLEKLLRLAPLVLRLRELGWVFL